MIISTIVKDEKDLQILLVLLKNSRLPFQDITLNGSLFKIYRNKDDTIIGSGGLEFYNQFALLRSVAVVETERGKTIGRLIVKDLLQDAKERPIDSVYLLTETASVFFEHLGFNAIKREMLPDPIKTSSEFSSVCPVSATCMTFNIKGWNDTVW